MWLTVSLFAVIFARLVKLVALVIPPQKHSVEEVNKRKEIRRTAKSIKKLERRVDKRIAALGDEHSLVVETLQSHLRDASDRLFGKQILGMVEIGKQRSNRRDVCAFVVSLLNTYAPSWQRYRSKSESEFRSDMQASAEQCDYEPLKLLYETAQNHTFSLNSDDLELLQKIVTSFRDLREYEKHQFENEINELETLEVRFNRLMGKKLY